jgi:16S rRNA U1498 N3-methylase RsmE
MVLSEIEELLAYVPGWEKEEGLRIKVVALESKAEKNLLALPHSVPVCKQVMTVIGPEGGWSDQEWNGSERRISIRAFGAEILRFETAA